MADMELEEYTLGNKHQQHNKLVLQAVENKRTVSVDDFNLDNSDLINLLNIDIASHNKNVEYILRVLTCDDMLYVSRAIEKASWLIKDQNYAHIVEPEYLRANLFPVMCSKAIIKLKKHIRVNLIDEKRAEKFYFYEENPQEAVKWLPCCSVQFIEKHFADHIEHNIKETLLRRLCEKSITILEIYIKNNVASNKQEALQANMFLLNSNIDKYLDLVEIDEYQYPTFNKRATSLLMKRCCKRIVDKFDTYYKSIHLPTFITCLKQENIKNFLISQAQRMKENIMYRIFNLKRLLLFIKLMPQDIRFEFVKQVFIDKKHESKDFSLSESERKGMTMLCNITHHFRHYNNHIWYQFAPFDLAFKKIKDLITSVSSPIEKMSMLEVVLTAAQNNVDHERTFLEYLRDTQKNAEYKEDIIIKLLTNQNFLRYDPSTWNILSDIFKSMDIYTETNTPKSIITESIILYKLIHKENIPEVVEKKFNFNSLVSYHKKLNKDEKEMVFLYLYSLITTKITKCNLTNENELKEKVHTIELALKLLKDFQKELEDYPTVICDIKDLIKIKTNSSWNVEMVTLFDVKKSWRKLLFEESLALCPTEPALINALKHGPVLLQQNDTVVQKILIDDKMTLRHVLSKIRIYWSDSFAKSITLTYTEKLNMLGNHKAITRGLTMLLPRRQLKELVERYTPKEAKVDWATINEIELSVQQQFAKTMHNARPQPFPETIIGFAKGDYLQYALPSLLSIFYNLNAMSSRKYIPNLLNAPVSLQKHGIRLAVSKLEHGELLSNFSNIWKNNKNASIRSVMFKIVYNALCNEKDSKKIHKTWDLMKMFIDNLSFQEDKAIYKLLFKVEKVPLEVRGSFYMKSYKFLHKLTSSGKEYEEYEDDFRTSFAAYSSEVVEQLHPDFVHEVITEFIDKEFTKQETKEWSRGCLISLISSYLLSAADEQTQLERFYKTLLPILKQSFSLWNTINDGKCFIRNNLTILLNKLRCNIEQHVVEKKKVIPYKVFALIKKELTALTMPEDYMLVTKWKLTVAFVDMLKTQNPILNWKETCIQIANEFGNKCNEFLIEDCNKYFPRIYLLFVAALQSMLDNFVPDITYLDIYRCLIRDESFIPGYLAAIKLFSTSRPVYDNDAEKELERKSKELRKDILKHPSAEIKIHFFNQIDKRILLIN